MQMVSHRARVEEQARVFNAHLVEGMHCSLVEPCSLRRVVVCIAGRRSSRVVSISISVAWAVAGVGRSVKVHADRVAYDGGKCEWCGGGVVEWRSGGDPMGWNDG